MEEHSAPPRPPPMKKLTRSSPPPKRKRRGSISRPPHRHRPPVWPQRPRPRRSASAAADAEVRDQFAREMELRLVEVARVQAVGVKAVFVPSEGIGVQMGANMAAGMAARMARQRIDELDEALRESKVALENARAENEGLRSEIAERFESFNPIASGDEKINAVIRRTPIAGPAETEPGIRELTELLEKSKTDTAELREQLAESKAERDSAHAEVAALQSLVDERTAELENLRKKVNREILVNGIECGKASSSKHDISTARDEITGLKHIVQELQMENSSHAQRNNALEQENNFLLSETEQLRQELKTLEENVEQSFMREEESLSYAADGADSADDIVKMQKKHETELEQLRKKLVEAERTSTRTIHDLNKEISELETLIESKSTAKYEDLESEIEKLKDKLACSQKKMSRSSVSTPTSATPSVAASPSSTSTANLETVCEICECPGHNIFTCDLLKDEGAPLGMDGGLMMVGLDGV
ncbi:uncharacterized protein LAESUDRAFT_763492 [Laetiporus sulphureus 93-53]|uniref:Uncharacterized protein n=1 Tax=Laetiporus sulphureus 93-53 TaxID=1314785 RepID=A0A165BW17_9APHY|nr:uncharacterized protein LAESUDRAFT_763492 [Laetiporus sulphureus 93-53]KZT01756.1 hypothetical protein LAESUDRAFT_763492 [Laetiporus sulphureus 93-53]